MTKTIRTALVLIAVQVLMVGVWFAVERDRVPAIEPSAIAKLGTHRLDRATPDLLLRRPDGSTARLAEVRSGPLLLHFWATWCPPCTKELPALLAYAAEADILVLAVSVDDGWDAVHRLLGPEIPQAVVRANSGDVKRAFDVHDLPVTYLVDSAGRLRLREEGPRDWASPSVRALVSGVMR